MAKKIQVQYGNWSEKEQSMLTGKLLLFLEKIKFANETSRS